MPCLCWSTRQGSAGGAVIPAGVPREQRALLTPLDPPCVPWAEHRELIALTSGPGAGGGAGSRLSLSPLPAGGRETLGTPTPCSDKPHHPPPALPSASVFSLQDSGSGCWSSCSRCPHLLPPRSPPRCSICSGPLPAPAPAPPVWRPSPGQAPHPPGCDHPDHPSDAGAVPVGCPGTEEECAAFRASPQCHPLCCSCAPGDTCRD